MEKKQLNGTSILHAPRIIGDGRVANGTNTKNCGQTHHRPSRCELQAAASAPTLEL